MKGIQLWGLLAGEMMGKLPPDLDLPGNNTDSHFRCNTTTSNVYTEVGKYLDWIGSQFDMLPPE